MAGDSPARTPARPNVLVVGAGIAGLACAHALVQKGVAVLLLEARDRVGGRLRTERDLVGGRPVEGGAMMVHGSEASVHRWIREFNLSTGKVPEFLGSRMFLEGKLRGMVSMALTNLRRLRAAYQTLVRFPREIARYRGEDLTLDRFLATRGAVPLAARFLGMMYGGINGADPEEVGVRGLAEDTNVKSGGLPWANYQVREGIDELAKRRAAGLGDRILLGIRVEEIAWSPEDVRVRATRAGGPRTYEADAAVVTFPLGVLKAAAVAFDPPLPEEKQRAIKTLGYGHANKILLVFDPSVRRTVLGRTVSIADLDGSWFFFPHRGEPRAPLVIEGFIAARKARALAGRPEVEVVERVLSRLGEMVPRVDLRAALRGARYVDWTADPYARGAYSFPTVGGGREARRDLAKPLGNVLFFAGEATDFRGEHATIHGALDSGERAAREVLDALRARGALGVRVSGEAL